MVVYFPHQCVLLKYFFPSLLEWKLTGRVYDLDAIVVSALLLSMCQRHEGAFSAGGSHLNPFDALAMCLSVRVDSRRATVDR